MAYFSAAFLDEILARTDLVELIAPHVQLKKSGANFMGLCPFHHEKSPSFSVSADKQLYYCFGCGKGGGAFRFLMEHDGYSFPEAVEYLAEQTGLEVPKDSTPAPEEEARKKQDLALLDRAASIFSTALHSEQGKPAREYFQRRGLPEPVIKHYRLGYAPPGYGFMRESFGRDDRILTRLEAVGLLFKGDRGYTDRFRARVMFPIRDRRGHVAGFGGRIIEKGEPKYLNSPETPYYHKSELLYGYREHRETIRKRKLLVVVEGYMDVLALAAHRLPVGLAPLGTAIGERQVREILRLHAEPVFCFDGDRAGRQAAWRALERMLPVLVPEHGPRFLYLPEGEDPDSLLQQEGADAFVRRIDEESKPILDTWIAGLRILAGHGAEGRARMAKKADTMLTGMQDDYLRQAWRQEAESATGIKLKGDGRRQSLTAVKNIVSPSAELQETFLAALIRNPTRIGTLPKVAKHFLLDDTTFNHVYTRALELTAVNLNVVQTIRREFPRDECIPRWANQQDVTDDEFATLLLAMESDYIERRRKQGGMSIEESTRMKKRSWKIQQQRRG